MRSSTTTRGVPPRPVYSGKETLGRVKSLTRGQGCGMISADEGDVFFHKADFKGEFFDLQVGDKVVFELLNDTISGKRAQNVRVAPPRKAPAAKAANAKTKARARAAVTKTVVKKSAPKPAAKKAVKTAAKKAPAKTTARKAR